MLFTCKITTNIFPDIQAIFRNQELQKITTNIFPDIRANFPKQESQTEHLTTQCFYLKVVKNEISIYESHGWKSISFFQLTHILQHLSQYRQGSTQKQPKRGYYGDNRHFLGVVYM